MPHSVVIYNVQQNGCSVHHWKVFYLFMLSVSPDYFTSLLRVHP